MACEAFGTKKKDLHERRLLFSRKRCDLSRMVVTFRVGSRVEEGGIGH